MVARFLLLFALLCCGIVDADAQKLTYFAQGRAQVTLPDSFVANELNDGTLRVLFGPAADHRLELTLVNAAATDDKGKAGERYVRREAEKKKLKIFESPGKVVFMEPGGDSQVGDKAYRTARWQIGLGNAVVLMTLTAPTAPSPDLTLFLSKRLEGVLASVHAQAE